MQILKLFWCQSKQNNENQNPNEPYTKNIKNMLLAVLAIS